MPTGVLREISAYVLMVAATYVVFASVPFVSARVCRRAGRGRRCTGLMAVAVALGGLPIWSAVIQRFAPLQSFLGFAGWTAVITIPVGLMLLAALFMLWRGPDREWRGVEVRRAIFGTVLCGVLGLAAAWQANDRLWGWGIAMSGCGIVRGTADYAMHLEGYRQLWWGDMEGWNTLECARELDSRVAGGEPEVAPAEEPSAEPGAD